MKNLLVTVSGGRSSGMMARHIQTHPQYADFKKVYVFANTGQERKETIDFLKQMVEVWELPLVLIEGAYSNEKGSSISYKKVDFENLSMNSEPFEAAIAHRCKGDFVSLPNVNAPYCSEMLKTAPSHKFAKDIFNKEPYLTAIGFRAEDMPKRISWAEIKQEKKRIFPLITDFKYPISQHDVINFWKTQTFDLQISSALGNCELCWKKSDKKLVQSIIGGTSGSIDFWQRMEIKYNSFAFRGNRSVIDLVKLSKQQTLNLFDDNEFNCLCDF